MVFCINKSFYRYVSQLGGVLGKVSRSRGFESYFPAFCLLCFFSWSFTNVLQVFVEGLIRARQCKPAKNKPPLDWEDRP